LFYVVQKWNELDGDTIAAKLWTSLKVTEGGLVVYGGVIGGLIAIVLWARKHRLPLLPIADSVTPAFFIGLAFGRIGCLLNGCCYGGICEQSLPAIEFPSGSPAYVDQLRSGKLLGMVTDEEPSATEPQPIRRVLPNSWASANNVVPGEKIAFVAEKQVDGMTPSQPYAHPVFEAMVGIDGRRIDVASIDIPRNSLPVHPTQIYAAVSGLLLCCWTLLLAENVKKTGFVFGMGLIGYGVLRNMEEWIRVDEAGQFGTSLSIAQWISLAAILLGVAIVVRAQYQRGGQVRAE
jgi:phosphatidylglycerol:prolipoprotein diacylglycerol transferase